MEADPPVRVVVDEHEERLERAPDESDLLAQLAAGRGLGLLAGLDSPAGKLEDPPLVRVVRAARHEHAAPPDGDRQRDVDPVVPAQAGAPAPSGE